jgi:hypothetical protein
MGGCPITYNPTAGRVESTNFTVTEPVERNDNYQSNR